MSQAATQTFPATQPTHQVTIPAVSSHGSVPKPLAVPSLAFFDRWMLRAENAVGIITILLSIAAFGLGLLVNGVATGTVFALTAFGLFGAVEMFHVQSKGSLRERMTPSDHSDLFRDIREAHPEWQPKVIKEFCHGGFFFRSIGFDKLALPLTITPPLCADCKGSLAERVRVRFPGIIRINFLCACGRNTASQLVRSELIREALEIANTPT